MSDELREDVIALFEWAEINATGRQIDIVVENFELKPVSDGDAARALQKIGAVQADTNLKEYARQYLNTATDLISRQQQTIREQEQRIEELEETLKAYRYLKSDPRAMQEDDNGEA